MKAVDFEIVRSLLREDSVEGAIEQLRLLIRDRHFQDEVNVNSARVVNLAHARRIGSISREQEKEEREEISRALVGIIQALEQKQDTERAVEQAKKTRIIRRTIVFLGLLLVVVGLGIWSASSYFGITQNEKLAHRDGQGNTVPDTIVAAGKGDSVTIFHSVDLKPKNKSSFVRCSGIVQDAESAEPLSNAVLAYQGQEIKSTANGLYSGTFRATGRSEIIQVLVTCPGYKAAYYQFFKEGQQQIILLEKSK